MNPILMSPNLNLAADSNTAVNYVLNACNYVTQVFGTQLPAISTGLFNVHMSQGIVVQPHWHTNADELVFVIAGEATVSVFNPFTQRLMTYLLKPGQVCQLPKGWFHWIVAMTDKTHLLTIFDQPTPDVVFGSDFIRAIPPEVIQRAYCIPAAEYARVISPLQSSVIFGPPPECGQTRMSG
ncbi:cupin domain-containing protein [Cohnella sp. LGH]|uniref:cupin domain-containing protein n=1 Tax=Cohnella sp. LGH TaxID=1619153 RepID=UPI0035301D23